MTSTVYRIVQESLTNVARHAPHARSVTVSVAQDQDGRHGRGHRRRPAGGRPPHHRGGYGLIGMRERVEALGGTLPAGPRPAPAGPSGYGRHRTPIAVRTVRSGR